MTKNTLDCKQELITTETCNDNLLAGNVEAQKLTIAFFANHKSNVAKYKDLTTEAFFKMITTAEQSPNKLSSKSFIAGEYKYENGQRANRRIHDKIDERNPQLGKVWLTGLSILAIDIDGFNGTLDELLSMLQSEFGQYIHCYYSSYSAFMGDGANQLRFRVVVMLDTILQQANYEKLCVAYFSYLKNKYPQAVIDLSAKTYNKIWFFGRYGGDRFISDMNTTGALFPTSEWLVKETLPLMCTTIKTYDVNKAVDINVDAVVSNGAGQTNGVNLPIGDTSHIVDDNDPIVIAYRQGELKNKTARLKSLLQLIKPDVFNYADWRNIVWGCSEFMDKHPLGYEAVLAWCQTDARDGVKWNKAENEERTRNLYYGYNTDRSNKIAFGTTITLIRRELEKQGCELAEHDVNGHQEFYNAAATITSDISNVVSNSPVNDRPNERKFCKLKTNVTPADFHSDTIPKNCLEKVSKKNTCPLTTYNLEVLLTFYSIEVRYDQNLRMIEGRSKITKPYIMINGKEWAANLKGWVKMDDIIDYVSAQCDENQIRDAKKNKIESLINLAVKGNPYSYLNELIKSKQWDGVNRIDQLISCLVLDRNLSQYKTDRIKRLIRLWLASVVAKQYEERPSNSGMIILHGKQGIGKTTFVDCLLPDKKYISTGQNIDPTNKDGLMAIFRKIIFELGECERILLTRESSTLKNILTSSAHELRLPYERAIEDFINRTAFIGTTNVDALLKDQTGNRRYWVIPLENIDLVKLRAIDMQQVWAELYNHYGHFKDCKTRDEQIASLGRYWTTKDEEDFVNEASKNNMVKSDFMEEVERYYDFYNPALLDAVNAYTISQLLVRCYLDNKISHNNMVKAKLGAELKAHGYHSFIYKNTTYYMCFSRDGKSEVSQIPKHILDIEIEKCRLNWEQNFTWKEWGDDIRGKDIPVVYNNYNYNDFRAS